MRGDERRVSRPSALISSTFVKQPTRQSFIGPSLGAGAGVGPYSLSFPPPEKMRGEWRAYGRHALDYSRAARMLGPGEPGSPGPRHITRAPAPFGAPRGVPACGLQRLVGPARRRSATRGYPSAARVRGRVTHARRCRIRSRASGRLRKAPLVLGSGYVTPSENITCCEVTTSLLKAKECVGVNALEAGRLRMTGIGWFLPPSE